MPSPARSPGLNATGCSSLAATRERFADGSRARACCRRRCRACCAASTICCSGTARAYLGALIQPAIRLAEDGFPAHRQLAANTKDRADLLAKNAAAKALFLPEGQPLAEGAIFRQPDLAAVLRAVADEGRR